MLTHVKVESYLRKVVIRRGHPSEKKSVSRFLSQAQDWRNSKKGRGRGVML